MYGDYVRDYKLGRVKAVDDDTFLGGKTAHGPRVARMRSSFVKFL